jgi:hypothetical protein
MPPSLRKIRKHVKFHGISPAMPAGEGGSQCPLPPPERHTASTLCRVEFEIRIDCLLVFGG